MNDNIFSGKYKAAFEALAKEGSIIPLTPEDILKLHQIGIEEFGGLEGLKEPGTFGQLCGAPFESFFGQELYPTITDKVACYFHKFATHQVFNDGNKRTAISSAMKLLEVNGFEFTLSSYELYNTALDTANNKYTVEELSAFFAKNIDFIQPDVDKGLGV